MDISWKTNPNILIDKYYEIIPNQNMSNNEWYNALTRLLICLIVIFYICDKYIYMYLSAIIILYIYIYDINENIIEEKFINPYDCQKPTSDNPFMNPLPGDDPSRKSACTDVNSMENATQFAEILHKNVNDLWESRNSQRNFNTNPNTNTPHDTIAFAKYLYDTPYSCKSGDSNHCLKYEDVRVPGYS